MNSKVIIVGIGVLFFFIFAGIFIVLNSTINEPAIDSNENKVEANNLDSTESDNTRSNINEIESNNLKNKHDPKLQHIVKNQKVVDQTLKHTDASDKKKQENKNNKEKVPLNSTEASIKIFEANFKELQKNFTSLEINILKKNGPALEKGSLSITDKYGKVIHKADVIKGKYFLKQILPGEYLLNFNFQGMSNQRNLVVLPHQKNIVEIYVPGSTLSIEVKNEDGAIITNVMITLFSGEKYRHENSFLGNKMVTPGDGKGSYYIMPKVPYCLVVEEDFRFNYQVNVIGPFILEPGETKKVDYVLPYARKLPKIQIVDANKSPLPDAGFNFSDENGNFFQRTLKKEWDLFPYSNQEGFLPERGWPIGNFTLIVGKEGYEFRETVIPIDFNSNQLLQIKLNKASSVVCTFPQPLNFPISVGILNKVGDLIQKPIPVEQHGKKELTVYFENISGGSVKFNDLTAGEYYIGYFWNGSNLLIKRQGPIIVGAEETKEVLSDLVR